MREGRQREWIQSRRSKQSRAWSAYGPDRRGCGTAYIYHREQNESCRGSFLRAIGGIDQLIDADAGHNKPGREEANNGNVIGLSGIRRHDNKDANDETEHKSNAEPGVIIKGDSFFLGSRNSGTHERDEPRKL